MSNVFIPFVIEPTWQTVLKDEWRQPYVAELAAFVEREYATAPTPVYPPKELIFNALINTPFNQTKVVIVGQDPYHGVGQAHGLSFSVPKGIKPPPSLQNIFKELQSDVQLPTPSHGCLLKWAKQGVLLLNATLTVSKGEPLSHHGKGWERLTDAIVKSLQGRQDPVIFVLWGKSAQDKCRFLQESDIPSRHFVLTAAHPSPYSADKGFFGCRHFSKVNKFLAEQGKESINWSLD